MGKKSIKKLVLNKNTVKQVKTSIKAGNLPDDSVARTLYNGTCTCPVAGAGTETADM